MDCNEDIKTDQTVIPIRESNQFFNNLVKIIKINRGFALAPFVIKKEKEGKYSIAISPVCTILSYLVTILVYWSIAYMNARTMRVSYNHYRIYYTWCRLFLTAMTNFR